MLNRSIFNKLYDEILEPEVSILLGPRQVGKTILLNQLREKARIEGYSTAYFNLESSSDLTKLAGNHQEIIKTLVSSGEVIFIDEFHYLKNASKLFKEIIDTKQKIKVYASGSSSLEIHKHLKESLAGRFLKTIIHPLVSKELEQVQDYCITDYFQWGGMPGLLHKKTEDEKMALLENIVNTYILKDIKGLIKEENVRAFNSMLYSLAQNQGSLTVAANIARETGIAEPTVASYLDIMSHTYVCHQIYSYSNNLANELKKSKKCYLFDIGIRNSLLKDFRWVKSREDKGILYESFVLQQLLPYLKPNMEIRFWRTKKGAEVDFILLINRQPVPIEVKSSLDNAGLPKGMGSFFRNYPKANTGFIVNETLSQECKINGKRICFLSLAEVGELIHKVSQEDIGGPSTKSRS